MVAEDKLLHFWVSFFIGLVSPYVSAAAGLGKEAFDAVSGGFADASDLLADALGILLALFVSPIW